MRWSLRHRLLALLAAVLMLGFAAASATMLYNARRAIRAEDESSALMATALLTRVVSDARDARISRRHIIPYVEALARLRHVNVTIEAPTSHPVPTPATINRPAATDVPKWFHWAMTVGQATPYRAAIDAGPAGLIVVWADPTEEIEEVWTDVLPLLALWAFLFALSAALLYHAVLRGLAPLNALLDGFERLERGDFPVRVREDVVRELAPIHARFNWTAAALAETLADNRMLASHMVDLREEERLILARELHDELSSHLFSVRMHVATAVQSANAARSTEVAQRLVVVTDMIAEIERVVKRMLHRLRPSTLDDLGLEAALADMVESWQRQYSGIHCELRMNGDMSALGNTLQVTVYRIVQECLTNVAKHSSARVVSLRIAVEAASRDGTAPRTVRIHCEDDGCGRPSHGRLGFGLRGIEERVRALGGVLTLSAPGMPGFSADASLPVSAGGTAAGARSVAA